MGHFKIAIKDVQRAVAGYANVTLEDLLGGAGNRALSGWRDVAFWVCRYEACQSYAEIGRQFRRHHTSVIDGVKRVKDRIAADEPQLSEDIHNVTMLAITAMDNRRLDLMSKAFINLDDIRARIAERGALDDVHSLWS